LPITTDSEFLDDGAIAAVDDIVHIMQNMGEAYLMLVRQDNIAGQVCVKRRGAKGAGVLFCRL
jgi:hypothetical protein